MKRLAYIDNLRIILIAMVIIAHAAITYGPVGFWYYYERTQLISTYFLAFYVCLMQAFLVGLLFMIAAFFIPSSLERKGPRRFLSDRIRRLGIPLLFYIFIISPLIQYLHTLIIEGEKVDFIIFYYGLLKRGIVDTGPLWFLQVLLLLSISYAILNNMIPRLKDNKGKILLGFPSNRHIYISIFILATLIFLVRIKFPIGSNVAYLNLGLAPQYIFLFGLGILAYRNQWFRAITRKEAKYWTRISLTAVISWPLFLFLGQIYDISSFTGGPNWQAFLYALWEAALSISISISVIYLFRQKFNYQNRILKIISRSTYFVFIIHSIVVMGLSYLLKDMIFHPLIKFFLVAVLSVIFCFLIGFYITKIKFFRNSEIL